MPSEQTDQHLDWTEENLERVINQIYAQAASDKAFHDKLMADPYEVLNGRIKVPDEYGKRIFAREKNKKMLLLNVPAYETTTVDPAVQAAPNYEVICTVLPW